MFDEWVGSALRVCELALCEALSSVELRVEAGLGFFSFLLRVFLRVAACVLSVFTNILFVNGSTSLLEMQKTDSG